MVVGVHGQGLKRCVLGLLALTGAVLSAQDGDAWTKREEAHEVLVAELESYVDWCNENRMFRSRARALERILTVDPEHEDARRILGYEKEGEDWFPPQKKKHSTARFTKQFNNQTPHWCCTTVTLNRVVIPARPASSVSDIPN